MPKRTDISSILVVGSGPIVIGQACEFDYSGTQACRALREQGYRVVLGNSNPATIMTDPEFADATYIEPLDVDTLETIIAREKPDALLPTVGGQTALNLAVALDEAGILAKYGVEMLGASIRAVKLGEDRLLFKKAMEEVGVAVLRSGLAENLDEARVVAKPFGYPVVIRPSFTLGGTGGGIAFNVDDFEAIVKRGLTLSVHEVLVEESVLGWKEFELEVMRDAADTFVVVCSIENLDPMGVHTGDSITIAPQMTLSDVEYQAMRDDARKVIRRSASRPAGRTSSSRSNRRRGGADRHRDESARLAHLGAGLEGDRLPDREDRGAPRRRLPAGRDPERHHEEDAGLLRADARLRRRQDPRFTFEKFPGASTSLASR